jgi:putative endonuclease
MKQKKNNNQWQVYILQCADKTLYTGITVDLARRLQEHNSSKLGAKYTRARRPVKIVYSKKFPNRSAASIAESKIKKLSRKEKLQLTVLTDKKNRRPR